MKLHLLFLGVLFLSYGCGSSTDEDGGEFDLANKEWIKQNSFKERVFKKDLYEIEDSVKIPGSVGNIYQLKADGDEIYFNDKVSIFRYKDYHIDTYYTPAKGKGPKEISQIFRFDVRDGVLAIAGYPDFRLLLHQSQTDSTKLIQTSYRGNILIDKRFNFYGEHSSNPSSYMITKFNTEGDSVNSFGKFFNNQDKSLNMFDYYWDYNEKHDLIIIGFMYAGYYAAIDTTGNVRYIVESVRYPANMPMVVNRNGMTYVETEGKTVLSGLSTAGDEFHVYTVDIKNKDGEIYGALIDVFNVEEGTYKFSYTLNRRLHWPIELLDNYNIAAVTEDFNLVIWKRD